MLKDMPIGSRVLIRATSKYYGASASNPVGVVGTVWANRKGPYLPYVVNWDNGRTNNYDREDLKYARGAPKQAEVKQPAAKKEEKPPIDIQAAIKKAGQDVVKKWKDSMSVGAYAFVHEDGQSYLTNNTACHAQAMGYQSAPKCAAIVTLIDRENYKENYRPYFDWLINRSPYSPAFVKESGDEAMDKGYATCRTDAPANLLQGALIATRVPHEHPRVAKLFLKLVEKGVGGSMAFAAASLTALRDGDSVVFRTHSGGHYPLDSVNMGETGVKRFVIHKPQHLSEDFVKKGSSRGVHNMFNCGNSRGTGEYVSGLLASCDKAGASTNKNPFIKAKKDMPEGAVSVSSWAEVLIKEERRLQQVEVKLGDAA